MTAEKIFYADPQNHVIVTESAFVVNNKEYRIKRIREHFVKVIRPILMPGIVSGLAGLFLIVTGMLGEISFHFIPETTFMEVRMTGEVYAAVAGILLLLTGTLMISVSKPHYALHIFGADGKSDVIISPREEYIRQIMKALNTAFRRQNIGEVTYEMRDNLPAP